MKRLATRPYKGPTKPSGVDWIGDIPIHWSIKRLKQIAEIINGGTPTSSNETLWDGGIAWITPADMEDKRLTITSGSRTISESGMKQAGLSWLPAGNTLISSRAPIGYSMTTTQAVTFNQGCKGLKHGLGSWMTHAMRAGRPTLEELGEGSTFKEVSTTTVAKFRLPSSPKQESELISTYLDQEQAAIDQLEATLAGLQARREALLWPCVTGKLRVTQDGNGSFNVQEAAAAGITMKPSGVDWIGDIPGHWEVRRLKQVVKINPEQLPESTAPDTEINYLEISDVDGNQEGRPKATTFGEASSRARRVAREGDTIISTVRTYLKAVQLISKELSGTIVSTGFAVLRSTELPPNLIRNIIYTDEFLDEVIQNSTGANYPAITTTKLGNLKLPIPSSTEAEVIAAYFQQQDEAISKMQRAIGLMRERMAILTEQCITGKLEVYEVDA